jgi:hypothetical protein
MAWKTDAYLNGEKTHLTCHSHGALFEIDTGEGVLGPCLGQKLTAVDIAVSDEEIRRRIAETTWPKYSLSSAAARRRGATRGCRSHRVALRAAVICLPITLCVLRGRR